MGLFINKGNHPDVFNSKMNIIEPNQEQSKSDYLSELIKEQNEAFNSMHDRFRELENLLGQQKNRQTNHWEIIGKQLNEIKESNSKHEVIENQVMDWLTKLDNKNMKLQESLGNERIVGQELMDRINSVNESNFEIVNKLAQHETANEQLALKMNEQLELQKIMSNQISSHEDVQNVILNRLDTQEGLTEKILLQIDHIRTIFFERTHYLVEKIEDSYKITSSYVNKLMAGSNQQLAHYKMKQKQVEKHKSIE